MNVKKNRAWLLVLAIALLGGMVALWKRLPSSTPPTVPGDREVQRDEGATPRNETLREGSSAGEESEAREELIVGVPGSPLEDAGVELAVEQRPLVGRVVDREEHPLPGVPVVLLLSGAPERAGLDFEAVLDVREVDRTETDGNGGFRFELPIGVPHVLRVPANEAAGWAMVERSPCFAGEEVILRVQPAGSLRGVVVEARTEAPVEGALVRLWGEVDSSYGPVPTGLDGSFRLGGLPPGTYICQTYPRAHRVPKSVDFVVQAGQTHEVRIEVERGLTLRGRITDAETGLPIEGAGVREGFVTPRGSVSSDAAGEYVLRGVHPDRAAAIHVVAGGYGMSEARAPITEEAEARLDFALSPGRRTVGRVLDGSERPLSGVQVAAVAVTHRDRLQRVDCRTTLTDDAGRFELTEVRRDSRHALQLTRKGYGTRIYDFPGDELESDRIDFGDLHLSPAGRIAGRVLRADGSPVPDVYLVFTGANADRYAYGRLPEAWSVDYHLANTNRSTNERGEFQFGSLAGGKWTVTAHGEGVSGKASATVVLAEGETVDSLEVVFPGGPVLAGRVTGPDGRGLAHAYVAVMDSSGRAPSVETGEGGVFRFEGLLEETYDVRVVPPAADQRVAGGSEALSTFWLHDVEVGREDLELRLPRAVKVRGRAVDADGEGVPLARIRVLDLKGLVLDQVIADEAGRFTVDAPENTPLSLAAQATIRDERYASGRTTAPGSAEGRLSLPRAASEEVVIRLPE